MRVTESVSTWRQPLPEPASPERRVGAALFVLVKTRTGNSPAWYRSAARVATGVLVFAFLAEGGADPQPGPGAVPEVARARRTRVLAVDITVPRVTARGSEVRTRSRQA